VTLTLTLPIFPLLDTCIYSIAPGEGTTSIQHAIKPCLKVLKLPHLYEDPLDKQGEQASGLSTLVKVMDAREII